MGQYFGYYSYSQLFLISPLFSEYTVTILMAYILYQYLLCMFNECLSVLLLMFELMHICFIYKRTEYSCVVPKDSVYPIQFILFTCLSASILFICIFCAFIMDPVYSSKRKKLPPRSEVHPDTFNPLLVTQSAKTKYEHIRHNLTPGIGTSFNSFPEIFEKIKHIGWESLVSFTDKNIYPELIAEFYSHMTFLRDSNDLLTGIHTCIHGQEYLIDETLILHALHLRKCMLDLPRINEFIHPIGKTTSHCITFKHNLATVTDQLVPAQLFDFPSKIGSEFLTAQCQFLSKLFRQNVMPVREDNLLHPFDLELMKCILTDCMPYNLPYFLLTSFEYCYQNNCLGFGLILTSLFKQLQITVLDFKPQLVQNSNIVSHLIIPPKPLITFIPHYHEFTQSHLNLPSQLDTLHCLHQLSLQNHSLMLGQIEALQESVNHLKDMIYMLMDNQKVSIPPYHFSASTSSAPDIPLPSIGLDFSPVRLEDF